MKKVLIVLTSHDALGNTGEKTGFWLEEFSTPYYIFKDAGIHTVLASPKGGQPPLDPKSNEADFQTESTKRFEKDTEAKNELANTLRLDSINADDYDAVFYPGGHGPLWDLAEDATSIALIEKTLTANKPLGTVCHAAAIFRHPKAANGESIVSGKKVTGFSNSEEDAVGLTNVVPFLVEDILKENGATYQKGDDWASFIAIDGSLVTGQNPASSDAVAAELIKALA